MENNSGDVTTISAGEFALPDYIIFISTLLVSLIVGLYSAFKKDNSTTEQYLVGGKSMPVIPVAISLLGGVISAISVLGNATEIYLHGFQLTFNLIGALWGILILRNLLLPVLHPLGILSLYKYIELRFDSAFLRKMTSLIAIITNLFYLGACLYTPSLALSSVTDISATTSVIIIGIICTIYITLGGVRAVVYTDVFQTCTMLISIFVVISIVCSDLGGVDNVRHIAMKGGRLNTFNFDFSPFVQHTFWSVQILGMYFSIGSIGLDQAHFQRFISVKSCKNSQLLCTLFYPGLFILWSLFYFSGLVAYAAYEHCDPLTSGRIEKADQIIPFLVADKLSSLPGLNGLFVAAIYGGVLSSLSSAANSAACIVWEDFFVEIQYFKQLSDRNSTNIIKILSAIGGLLSIAFSILMSQLGTIFQAVYSTIGALKGPADGLFIAGIFAPWVNTKGAVAGFITSFVFNLWLVIGRRITGAGNEDHLSLSTDGCPESENITIVLHATSTPSPPYITTQWSDETEKTVYDISYCYIGTLGIIIVYIVSSLTSIITGVTKPSDVNPAYVNKTFLSAYKYIYNLFNKDSHKVGEVVSSATESVELSCTDVQCNSNG